MAIRLPSHLHRARSGILYFRIAIPPDLRIHFKTREIYRSLRTSLAAINGTAGAGIQASNNPSILFSGLIQDYKRDRLAAGKWTPKTQDENLAVYKLCLDIIGDLPISDVGDDQALTYVETLKKLPANMNKMPAYRGKTISEVIVLNPPPMAT
jgi:hypothetical protein